MKSGFICRIFDVLVELFFSLSLVSMKMFFWDNEMTIRAKVDTRDALLFTRHLDAIYAQYE